MSNPKPFSIHGVIQGALPEPEWISKWRARKFLPDRNSPIWREKSRWEASLLPPNLATGLHRLPNAPGLYRLTVVGYGLAYIGIAQDIQRRVTAHAKGYRTVRSTGKGGLVLRALGDVLRAETAGNPP